MDGHSFYNNNNKPTSFCLEYYKYSLQSKGKKTKDNTKYFLKPPPEKGVLRSGQIKIILVGAIEAWREGGPGRGGRWGSSPT